MRPFLRSTGWLCGCIAAAMALAGCRPDRTPEPRAYTGPTLPLVELVSQVNANSERVPTLRAEGDFEATIVDPEGRRNFINGQVTVLYSRPDSLRLVGKKDVLGQVFEVGSNPDRYWLIVRGDQDTMWWGSYENFGQADTRQIPIRPDLILEVLGITPINTNLLAPPAPVLRFNPDADAYMLVWVVPLENHWAVQKEIWYDRQTLLPQLVVLFDENGRVVLRAYLSQHRPVEVPSEPQEQWPKLASRYQLLFPETGSRIELKLDDLALQRNRAPNPRSFTFPESPGVSRQISLDEPANP